MENNLVYLNNKIKNLYTKLTGDNYTFNLNISEILNKNMSTVYLTLYDIVNYFLEDFYYDNLFEQHAINIRGLVQEYGISIIERKIQTTRNFIFYNQIEGYLDIFNCTIGDFKISIHVDENLDEFSKRYVIAHEFSHCVLELLCNTINSNTLKQTTKFCLNTLFPKDIEEHICDIMTAFFLMPIDIVVPLMLQFIEEKQVETNGPIHMNTWLKFLSCHTKISNYHVNTCFQHIRYLGSFLYNENEQKQQNEFIKKANKLFR